MITTLQIDATAIAGQTRVAEAVIRRHLPLFEQIPQERVRRIIDGLFVELKGLIISYNVTTILADGASKTVRTIRYRGCIEDFTTAFCAKEFNLSH